MATRSKLAVILHADVVASSALVQIDERVAHDRIRDAFTRASKAISDYGGQTLELRGDALLAEFERASDAVTAALAIQARNSTQNLTISDEIRPLIRVGLALGEVVIADDTITGPGVVIAQRLEQLAEPGGVCIQGSVQESVPKRLPFDYQDLGSQVLKGFDEPVRAFSVAVKADAPIPEPELQPSSRQEAPRVKYRLLAGAVVALLLAALGVGGWLASTSDPIPSNQPSVAVLAFSNLSNDPEQDYFGEGIAEDIITDLSKIPDLLVTARNSSFSFQGKNTPIKTVARELGVRYVLEGSVRRAGDALRINAQLIDASTDSHLWAERYDGKLNDVFALQDTITRKIVAALSIKLSAAADRDLKRAETVVPEAYDAFLRGKRHINARDREALAHVTRAREEFQSAVDLDPSFARAFAGLGWAYWIDFVHLNSLERSLRIRAFELADKSLALADNALARRLRAKQFFAPESVGMFSGYKPKEPEKAVSELRKGVALEPNNADALAELAYTLVFAGRPDEATELMRKATRLNPNFPPWYHRPAGIAHYMRGDYAQAVPEFKAWYESDPSEGQSLAWLAAAYAQTGDIAASRNAISKLPRRRGASVPQWNFWTQQHFANQHVFARDEDKQRFMDGLGKAGVRNALDD